MNAILKLARVVATDLLGSHFPSHDHSGINLPHVGSSATFTLFNDSTYQQVIRSYAS